MLLKNDDDVVEEETKTALHVIIVRRNKRKQKVIVVVFKVVIISRKTRPRIVRVVEIQTKSSQCFLYRRCVCWFFFLVVKKNRFSELTEKRLILKEEKNKTLNHI